MFTNATVNTTGFTSTIEFEPNPNITNFPATSSVKAYVTDCNGCTTSETLSFSICSPVVDNLSITIAPVLGQNGNTVFTSTTIQIPEPDNCSADIDWSSIEFSLPSSAWTALDLTTSGQYWSFQAPSTITPGIYLGTYNLKDEYGIPSNIGIITFTVLAGPNTATITIPNQTFQVDCLVYDPLDDFEINVEDLISVNFGATID